MENTKKKIKEILIEDLKIQGITPDEIKDTDPLFGDGLGLDSLDAVELVVLIQKYFDVQIADMEEGEKAFESVECLAKFILEKKG